MSDVKVEHKQALSREEAAEFIAALSEGLGEDGRVSVRLGSSVLELSVARQVDCELEVSVDGDEIELELGLKWSTSDRSSVDAAQEGYEADELEDGELEPDELELDEGEFGEGEFDEDPSDEGDAQAEIVSVQDAVAADVAADGAAGEEADASTEAASVPVSAKERSARPPRGRRKVAEGASRPAFNGVDTAAVRAWAAANGVTVSPRGRIKDEVIEAYRAAGN